MAWRFYDDTGAEKVIETSGGGGGGDPTMGGDLTGTASTAQIAAGAIVNADVNVAAAIALSKLATDPLARANHTGTQLASTVSDFDTQVRTSRLDQMALPTAAVPMGSQKITGLAAGTANGDALRYEQLIGAYLLLSGGTLTGNLTVDRAGAATTGRVTVDVDAGQQAGYRLSEAGVAIWEMYKRSANDDFRLNNEVLAAPVFTVDVTTNIVDFNETPTKDGSTIWHAGNDGAASTLDADLLDAQHGTYYLDRANHSGTQAATTVTITDAAGDFTATEVEGALAELQADAEADATALSDHVSDATGAHAATAISVDSTNLVGTSITVQGSLDELDNAIVTAETSISNHISDATAAHAGTAISVDSTTLVGTATDVQGSLEELDNAIVAAETSISNHLSDATDAHDATAISVDSTNLVGTSITVQGSLEELDDAIVAVETSISNHLSDATDAHDASSISIVDAGGDFTATDVEGALAELQADHETDATALSDHISDATAAHAASAISIVDAGGDFTATDVEGALAELAASPGGSSAAADITIVDAAGDFTATNVEDALAELQSDAEADATALSDHISDTTAAHAASAVSVNSATLVGTGTDVQAVFEELDNSIADHLADATDAHAGTAITNTPAGNIAATTVQAAINELDTDKSAVGHAHAAGDVTSGTFATARLGANTANSDRVLRGDSEWAFEVPPHVAMLRAAGCDMKAAVCDPLGPNTTNNMVDGSMMGHMIVIPYDCTITGVWFNLATAGSITADNNNKVALFTFDSTNLTCVAASANNATLWHATANTYAKEAFTSTYAASAGIYVVARLPNWSAAATTPSFRCAPNIANSALANAFLATNVRTSFTINRTNIAVSDTIAWSGTANTSVVSAMGLY